MRHFMIDGFHSVQSKLDDMKYIYDFLIQTVDELDMKPIMPPYLLPYFHGKKSEDNGISAFVLLNGGHFTIHTFTYRECFFADLVYPEYYNTKKLLNQFETKFPCLKKPHHEFLDRRFATDKISIDKNKALSEQIAIEMRDFGPHFFAGARDVKQKITMELIFDILEELPAAMGMSPIMRPYVLKNSHKNPTYISGIITIAESHISIHYDMSLNQLYIDLFSCEFNLLWDVFKKALEMHFGPEIEITYVPRGKKYEIKGDLEERELRHNKWLDNVGYNA